MTVNTKGRLIIVDPSLQDTRGHHYSLTRVIVDSVLNSGFQVVVFSSLFADEKLQFPGARIRPVFSKTTYDYFKPAQNTKKTSLKEKLHLVVSLRLPESIKVILRKIRNKLKILRAKFGVPVKSGTASTGGVLQDELMEALIAEQVTGVGHILVHTADGMMYRAILQLLLKKYPLGEHPSYHLCTPYDIRIMPHASQGMPVDNVIKYMQLMGFINQNVFLYAENELLADSLSHSWHVEVKALDIPMRKINVQYSNQQYNDSVFRVVYLGAAREEKGFHLLYDVVKDVLSAKDKELCVEFVIQCSPQIVGYTSKIEATIEKLRQFSSDEVKLIQTQQSELEYYSVLESADVVLCCYKLENYRVRGSGIATEAVAFGKTVITTPGTYPAWLAGDAGYFASNSKEISAAILSVIKNREKCKGNALKRAEWFSERTRPEEYINKLLASEENAKKHQDVGYIQRTALNDNNAVSHDDSYPENKYNVELCEAAVSSDGKVLFVKQISK